ncbi:hypothetical protein F442_00531 [Phytophthora nicotianae P10297]|uniref:RxLR effector protein n=5 Tax=Phytophthora nicotianae TaxID=4792 RepID=W2RF21_PHYN3|nr:hypothetical protein PPTG_00444 [Phytophthora nicotianae INRA-310]ETI57134.1 hypothetical protein F443_00540 [Phytophthora nicotianae P1569]ETL50217.1 hypothetical protein L916_00519 [Phytophthora nicotianae]ETO85870.1 hypothetical protein F444_00537 [Phytophthora nicotianae P1976]ETP54866.1 hypothetical protein F442_00531 [Phytophthora nicotianae P10297]ETM56556.1 hypothetical protein, variant [Phytophthora nicotianae]
MHLYYVVAFVVATLLASVEGSSMETESKEVNPTVQLDRVLKSSLRAEKVMEPNDELEEERGKFSEFFTKLSSKLTRRKKKVDPKVLAKADDLVNSPKVDPKVLAKADDLVTSPKLDPKVIAKADSKVATNAVKPVPKQLTAVKEMPEEKSSEAVRMINGFVKDKKTLDDVFTSQVNTKWENTLFKADGLPMYVRFSELTAKQRGHDTYGVNLLVTKYGQEKLMQAVNTGLSSGDDLAVATADRLRAGLLNRWWNEKKDPTEVARLLKGGNTVVPSFSKELVKKYRGQYNAAYISSLKP